jgi:hypothetical protein
MAWYDDTSKKSAVREYKSRGEMDRDVARAAERGWRVVSATEMTQRSGCLRGCTLGLLALVWRPKAHFLVTFSRE